MSLSQAPVLSTPESHIFEDPTPILIPSSEARLSDKETYDVYEVERTAREIVEGGWKRIALQFPDSMLGDGVRVFEGLEIELAKLSKDEKAAKAGSEADDSTKELETSFNNLTTEPESKHRLYILADTSYGACCVDEIAAEHVDAEVVVHYGRSCLSPTARLPVIYVFTSRPLPLEPVIEVFETTYQSKDDRIILMADIIYHSHIPALHAALAERGWNILAPEIIHDPNSQIPNRKIDISEQELKTCAVFHISDPPPALLLTLSSRVKDLSIYPTTPSSPNSTTTPTTTAIRTNTALSLRRRYALLTSLTTCPIFGILINTLSVSHYLSTISLLQDQIAAAGKKSYTFVVGKVNAAKIANFEEIGGWVVVGCWESSLLEGREFYRPCITPFELGLALMGDGERVWSGEWRGGFSSLEDTNTGSGLGTGDGSTAVGETGNDIDTGEGDAEADIHGGDLDSEEESLPPEFDLRTGSYVSHSRPMRTSTRSSNPAPSTTSTSTTFTSSPNPNSTPASDTTSKVLTRRTKMPLATINGTISPGAEYLRTQRTWTGLGSDFHDVEAHPHNEIEEGRSGVARGYRVVGEGEGERR